jgi:hypothetical protein
MLSPRRRAHLGLRFAEDAMVAHRPSLRWLPSTVVSSCSRRTWNAQKSVLLPPRRNWPRLLRPPTSPSGTISLTLLLPRLRRGGSSSFSYGSGWSGAHSSSPTRRTSSSRYLILQARPSCPVGVYTNQNVFDFAYKSLLSRPYTPHNI